MSKNTYVQFYNKRNKRWAKAKKQENGLLRIVKTSEKKFSGVPVLKKSKKRSTKKRTTKRRKK